MAVEKRRRKKARIQAESSSEDSDSSADEQTEQPDHELSELSDADDTMDVRADQTMESADDDSDDETPRERLRKVPQSTDTDVNQIFLAMVTEQFGEELAKLRESNDFGAASISQLVAGLKQGADIFTEDQKRMLE